MFTAAEILELVKGGVTPAEIVDLQRASSTAEAASTVVAPPSPKAGVPDWIVEHAIRKQARRALAADLRSRGIDPKGAAWTKAKKAAKVA